MEMNEENMMGRVIDIILYGISMKDNEFYTWIVCLVLVALYQFFWELYPGV